MVMFMFACHEGSGGKVKWTKLKPEDLALKKKGINIYKFVNVW